MKHIVSTLFYSSMDYEGFDDKFKFISSSIKQHNLIDVDICPDTTKKFRTSNYGNISLQLKISKTSPKLF